MKKSVTLTMKRGFAFLLAAVLLLSAGCFADLGPIFPKNVAEAMGPGDIDGTLPDGVTDVDAYIASLLRQGWHADYLYDFVHFVNHPSVNDKTYYRLPRTENGIYSKYELSEWLEGVGSTHHCGTDNGTLCMDNHKDDYFIPAEFDFSTLNITVNGGVYVYSYETYIQSPDDYAGYYTVSLDYVRAIKNKLGASGGMWKLYGNVAQYVDPDNLDSYHRDYSIYLHAGGAVRVQDLYNFLHIGNNNDYYLLRKMEGGINCDPISEVPKGTVNPSLNPYVVEEYDFSGFSTTDANYNITKNGVTYQYRPYGYVPGADGIESFQPYYTIDVNNYEIKAEERLSAFLDDNSRWLDGSSREQWGLETGDDGHFKAFHRNYPVVLHNEISVRLVAKSFEKSYTGEEQTVSGYEVYVGNDETPTDITFSGITASGSGTAPGVYDVVISGASVGNIKTSSQYPGKRFIITEIENGTLTIGKKPVTIKAADGEWTYDGNAHSNNEVTVTSGSLFEGDVLMATASGSVTNVADTATGNNPVADGYKIMRGDEDVTDSYAITVEDGTLTINPKAVTITAQDKAFVYNGTAQNWPEYDVDGLVGADAITAVVTGNITFPSESPVANVVSSYSFTAGTAGNYTVTTANGELTMTNASVAITITATDDEWIYDGTAHSNNVVTVTSGSLLDGDELVATATGSVTDVTDTATGNNQLAEGYKIMHGNEDVTANYAITVENGTLTIEKRIVTLNSESEVKTYDGTPLSAPSVTVGGDGFVEGEVSDIRATGSVTTVAQGLVTNTITYTAGESFKEENYTITKNEGTLRIAQITAVLEITSSTKSWTYDGQLHKDEVYTVTFDGNTFEASPDGTVYIVTLPTGDIVTITPTSGGIIEYSSEGVKNYFIYQLENDDCYANVTINLGTLTINPKAVTITAQDKAFVYNGTAQSWDKYDVVGLVGNDAITAVVTGSITFPSESPVVNKVESYEFATGTPGNYSITTANGELTMTNASIAITITAASDEWTYDGTTHSNTTVTVTEGSLLDGDELVATATGSVTNVADTVTGNNPVASGYKIMHGDKDVTENYAITTVAGTLTINPKAVTITAQDKAFTYNGTAQSWDKCDVDGLVGSDAIKATVTGSITFPSQSPVVNELTSYEFTTGDPNNYTVTTANGQLTMTSASVAITITSGNGEWTYDGTAHSNTEVTITSGELLAGDRLVAEAIGSVTNVADSGTGNNFIYEDYKIMHGDVDVSDNYAITTVAGTLTINPKAVTVTAQDKEFTYNGTAQRWPEYGVDGLVGDDEISAVVTGSITFPSESPVTNELTSYEFTTGTPGNYTVTTADGELTMINASVEITITSASDEWTYDGTAHTNSAVTVTGGTLFEGDELVAEATGSVTNVADTSDGNNTIASGYKIMHGDEDVTESYVISTVEGTLTINPKAVTITAQDKEFTYNGTAQSWDKYDVDGLVGDDKISAVVTGSITFPSESPVTNELTSYEFTTGTPGNYTVTTADGELTMINASVEITITSASDVWTYDSTTHTNSTVTVTSGELFEGDELVATATGSVTNVADTSTGNNPIAEDYKVMHGTVDVTSNYVITTAAGTLTINPKTVTVTAQDKQFTYNGTAQSWPEYDVDGLVGGDAITAVVTGNITFPSESPVANVVSRYNFIAGTAGNYTVTTANGELTMTNASVAITITAADGEWTYDGTAHSNTDVTITSGSLLEGDELVATASGNVTNVADTAEGNNPVAEGYKIMHGTEDVTANYTITPVAGTLTINPKAVTVTAQDKEFTYTGTAQSWDKYDVVGLVGEDAISAVVEGSITFPSDSPVTNKLKSYEFTTGMPGNYSVTTADGQLTMTNASAAITITAASGEWTYDGTAHENTAVTVTEGSLLEGDELVATATGSVTNVADTATGNNPIAEGYKIMHGDMDVTGNYTITPVAGTLTINKRSVTLTSESDSREYNGTALTNPNVTVSGDGFVPGEVVDIKTTGSVTLVSSVTNTITFTVAPSFNADNYDITKNEGILSIDKRPITITANDANDEYNGSDITYKSAADAVEPYYSISEGTLADGQSITAITISGSGKEVGNYTITITEGSVEIGDYTSNYDITLETGTLTIKQNSAEIKVVPGSDSKKYDGTPLTKNDHDDFEVTGVPEGFTWTAVANGTVTNVVPGADENATNAVTEFKIFDGEGNDVTDQFANIDTSATGTLTITKRSVTLTSADDEKEYDGTALSNSEITVSEDNFAEGEGYVADVTGSVINVGTAENTFTYVLNENTLAGNYEITIVFGTLEVTPLEAVLEWSDTKFPYDGENHVPTATVSNLIDGDECKVTVTGEKKEVGEDYVATATELSNPNYKLPENNTTSFSIYGCAVIFKNDDGTVLAKIGVPFGTKPVYEGDEPTKEPTAQYVYEFDGWTPEIVEVEAEETVYTATYQQKTRTYTVEPSELPEGVKLSITDKKTVDAGADVTFTITIEKGYDKGESFAVKVNGKAITPDENGTYKITGILENVKITVSGVEKVSYSVVEGDKAKHVIGENTNAKFVFKRSVNDSVTFSRNTEVLLDGKALEAGQFTKSSGSLIVELKPDYMDTLSVGEHTLTVRFSDYDGDVNATLIVEKAADPAPGTGDTGNLTLWIVIGVVSLVAFLALFLLICKRRKDEEEEEI